MGQLGIRIVEKVAVHKGVDPINLDNLLYDAIDVDSLENLTNSYDSGARHTGLLVEFTFCNCTIAVDGRGRVSIDEDIEPPAGS